MIVKFFAFLLVASFFFLLIRRNSLVRKKDSFRDDAIDVTQLKDPSVLLKLPGIKKRVEKELKETHVDIDNPVDRD